MLLRVGSPLCALFFALGVACTASSPREVQTPVPRLPAELPRIATTVASPAPQPMRVDIRASRLAIPSLNIDSQVQLSQVIPDTSIPAAGCPARPEGEETFTVPDRGIATPEKNLEGIENKAWIFGHSRWQNQPGVFNSLQDISVGDELFVDGFDRGTGEQITRRRFVVDGLYLTDIDSGAKLVTAESPADIPAKPLVILQTSVREDGANKQWLLNRQKVVAKSRSLIEGDVNDPCKYLLLFITAQPS